ncbi:hypothetical protein ACIRSU_19765 [Streptomyces sp. NPDC101160]|uniref:hypothetical protein n=1 Tax=Streptomyces sp. NPDC101160 TaxID=3366118 RepID=UPI00380F6E86
MKDDELRDLFAHAVRDVTPGPVPLAAVRRRGRALRRRRTVTVAALAVLAVSGVTTVTALFLPGPDRPVERRAAAASPSPAPVRATPSATPVRVVRPGERVAAGRGWTVWLTSEGKFWKGPDGIENSRSVTDGNLDTARPGISYQSEGNASGAFHSGLYYGTRDAGRVELRGPDGRTTTAALLELPGRPGWGVWYVHSAVTGPTVVLYDRKGARLADLPGTPTGR